MTVNFRLASIEISNFRGIQQLTLELQPGVTTYLIGANNSGKSTILQAFALALRGGGFHTFRPEPFDFFHDRDGALHHPFEVSLAFDADDVGELPAIQGVGAPEAVHGIRVVGTQKANRLEHRHALYGADGKLLLFSPRTPLKGEAKDTYKDHGLGWRKYYARPDDIRQFVPEVWLLRADNLNRSLYVWRTGPLQRLSRLLTTRFLTEKWDFAYGKKSHPMPKAVEKVHEFFQEAVEHFPFWTDDLKPKLEETLSNYLGRHAILGLHPQIQTLEDWLAQQLAASFSAEVGGPLTPLDRMGDGWQSLVRIASLDVLRKYPEETKERVVLLFEEPETYLHPHLRRKLRTVLDELSALGWVVVCSTHAPEFVSFATPQSIARLWRDGGKVERGTLLTQDLPEAAKFQERLDERGNHEMLFANRLVLCEGKDDFFGVRLYLDKCGVDLDGRSISLLDVGGTQNLPAYARMASTLRIPWCALTDEDKDATGAVNQKTAAVRETLENLKGPADATQMWLGSLEACVGLSDRKATPDWQQAYLAPQSRDELTASLPDFAATCEAISKWLAA